MSNKVVFLFAVDNTLLDNDGAKLILSVTNLSPNSPSSPVLTKHDNPILIGMVSHQSQLRRSGKPCLVMRYLMMESSSLA